MLRRYWNSVCGDGWGCVVDYLYLRPGIDLRFAYVLNTRRSCFSIYVAMQVFMLKGFLAAFAGSNPQRIDGGISWDIELILVERVMRSRRVFLIDTAALL